MAAAEEKENSYTTLFGLLGNKRYEKCKQIYKKAGEVINSDNIDPLVMAIIQNYMVPDKELSIQDIIRHRMEILEDGNRQIKVYIAGEVATGKSSLVNAIMGEDYLPTAHGSCTAVLCEVWNSEFKRARLRFKQVEEAESQKYHQDIELDYDKNSQAWKTIQSCIENKSYKGEELEKVEIYWPCTLLRRDLQESSVKTAYRPHTGSIEYSSDYLHSESSDLESSLNDGKGLRGNPAVCWMDFPGIDDGDDDDNLGGQLGEDDAEAINKTIQPYINNLKSCHAFIFVIDVSRDCGVDGKIQKLMKDISTNIQKQGISFNPESALFLLNGRPQKLDEKKKQKLHQQIFDRLHKVWPSISEQQIIYFDNITMISRDSEDVCRLQTVLIEFLVRADRLVLEEQCMWLSKLMETVCALIKSGKKWHKIENVDSVKKDAQEYKVHISQILSSDLSPDTRGNTYGNLQEVLNQYKQKYREELGSILDEKCSKEMKNKVLEKHKKLQRKFEEEINERCEKFINEKVNRPGNKVSTNRSDVPASLYSSTTFIIASLMLLPVCKLVMFGQAFRLVRNHEREQAIYKFLHEKGSRLSEKQKGEVIKVYTEQLGNYLKQKIQNITKILSSKIEELDKIVKVSLSKGITDRTINYGDGGGDQNNVPVSMALNDLIGQLWDFYVGEVMKHEIQSNQVTKGGTLCDQRGGTLVYEVTIKSEDRKKQEILAMKEIFTSIKKERESQDKSDSSSSHGVLPHDSTIYMECVLMSQLSHKVKHRDYEYFVKYRGSSRVIKDSHYSLQMFMKRYDCSLGALIDDTYSNLDPVSILEYALSAARGVRFIHSQDIIHRDIKTSNFLVDGNKVVICDVGHSKECDKVKTTQGRGTFLYQAPELVPTGLHTLQSDIYSFGLVLWEVFYGVRLTDQSVKFSPPEQPPKNRQQRKDLTNGKEIYNLVWKCLSVKPKERPTIYTIVEELQRNMDSQRK